jgi:hypothetical protein
MQEHAVTGDRGAFLKSPCAAANLWALLVQVTTTTSTTGAKETKRISWECTQTQRKFNFSK